MPSELIMKSELTNIIRRYLNAPNVPYALLIDGEWGSGKSWYFKNQFETDFEGRKVVYTSVNGISSLEQLTAQLFILRPPIKNVFKGLVSIAKSAGTWFANDKIGLNLNLDLSNLIQFKIETDILIIDDCERLDPELSIASLLGYVSRNFTEKSGVKAILIADEERLLAKYDKDDSYEYQTIKEKTIWQTIEFITDLEEIYDNLLTGVNTTCQGFLKSKKSLIISLLKEYDITNLRWVLYFFQCIEEIVDLPSLINSPSQDVIINSLIILTKEYKEGNLTERTDEDIPRHIKTSGDAIVLKDFDNHKNSFIISVGNDGVNIGSKQIRKKSKEEKKEEKLEQEKSDRESLLINKFYAYTKNTLKIKYKFFKSLYDLVCFGSLDDLLFNSEIMSYDESIVKLNPWNKIIDRLLVLGEIEEEEFKEIWPEMITYLKSYKYDLNDLENIAGLYEVWSKLGITFPIQRQDIYKLLNDALENCKFYDQNRESYYQSVAYDNSIESSEYNDFIEKSAHVQFNLLTESKENKNAETLSNLINQGIIPNDKDFLMLLSYGNEDQIIHLSKWLSESVERLKLLTKILRNEKHNIRIEINHGRKENYKLLLAELEKQIQDGSIKMYNYKVATASLQKFLAEDKLKQQIFSEGEGFEPPIPG